MKTSGQPAFRPRNNCSYLIFITNTLLVLAVILFLNVSPLSGKFTSLEASEGLCPAPGSLPVAEQANYPWLLIGRRYFVPMASRHAIHKYAEVFLGRPVKDQYELNRMNLQIEHVLGKYRKMGFDREFRQLCLSESRKLRRFPRNLLERYCYVIRSWLSGEGTDVNQMATSLDTVVWTDNHTAILVTKCINHMYFDWEVYSIEKTLLPHVRDQILQVVQFLGFSLHNVLYYDYEHHKFFQDPHLPLVIGHGPPVGLLPFKALPPPPIHPHHPPLHHHPVDDHANQISVGPHLHHHKEHIAFEPHLPHHQLEPLKLDHIPVDPHLHHHEEDPHPRVYHHHHHPEHVNLNHFPHSQHHHDEVSHHQVEHANLNHIEPHHHHPPSAPPPVVHTSHGLKGHVQEKHKLRDYGPMSYYAVEVHPDPEKGYYSHPPPEFLQHHHQGETHVIKQDPVPYDHHQQVHNPIYALGQSSLTGPSGPAVPINYAPLVPSYSEEVPVKSTNQNQVAPHPAQLMENSKKLLERSKKFAEQQQAAIQQLYHNPVVQQNQVRLPPQPQTLPQPLFHVPVTPAPAPVQSDDSFYLPQINTAVSQYYNYPILSNRKSDN